MSGVLTPGKQPVKIMKTITKNESLATDFDRSIESAVKKEANRQNVSPKNLIRSILFNHFFPKTALKQMGLIYDPEAPAKRLKAEKTKTPAKRGKGRPATGRVRLCARVSPATNKKIRAAAKKKKCTPGELLNEILS